MLDKYKGSYKITNTATKLQTHTAKNSTSSAVYATSPPTEALSTDKV